MRLARGKPPATWEDITEKLGQKHERTKVKMKRISEDPSDWLR